VLILKEDKVFCFDALLQVLIPKGVAGDIMGLGSGGGRLL
jgi:hypothetical protein